MSADEWFRGGEGGDIEARIAARTEAKARRDFAEADRIRDELAAEGMLLEDGPSGTTWRQGMTAPLYTREILRLAASIPYLERASTSSTARPSGARRPAAAGCGSR